MNLRDQAREIFDSAMQAVDARQAVERVAKLDGQILKLCDQEFDISLTPIYVIAIGKAAPAMATGLNEVLGSKVNQGLISCPRSSLPWELETALVRNRWRVFAAGHPLPNASSLTAAYVSMDLLKRADEQGSLVIFLVSGGGSAMLEWPRNDGITLEQLAEANQQLVSCGATIAEINAVRRTFSAVKGGKLAALAPRAHQITFIVSDTNEGDEANVASGPTLPPPRDAPDPTEVIERYGLRTSLPESILRAVGDDEHEAQKTSPVEGSVSPFVLLSNQNALETAAATAKRLGFHVEIAADIREQGIANGCDLFLSRMKALSNHLTTASQPVCLLSGGEFSCPVRGDGLGGRNQETVLRCAIHLDENKTEAPTHTVILSAGTDGIDGRSPAAGAIADQTTIARARSLGLDADDFLKRSDSFRFFNILNDAVITGPTGTNVRDLRILLAGN